MKYLGALLSAGLIASSSVAFADFQVDVFDSGSAVTTLATADTLIGGVATASATSPTIDYYDGSGGTGHFGGNNAFPGALNTTFALHATCTLTIPTTGDYTFGTSNDDGVRLRIDGTAIITDSSTHPVSDFFGTAAALSAGLHSLDFVYFENTGGGAVELFAKAGNALTFTGMTLIGDTGAGGLACNSVVGTTGTIAITGSEAGSPVTVTVTDADLNANAMVAETVVVAVVNDTTGETESVTLTETGPDTGIFVGTLDTAFAGGAGADNDGVLNTLDPNTLTASYNDALDAGGNSVVATATANMNSHVEAENVPTLSAWGLMLMSGLLGLMGVYNSRKKKQQ